MAVALTKPTFEHEDAMIASGRAIIVGLDEAGRGPLAGPVVASSVILNRQCVPEGLDDSKKMTETARERAYEIIMATARVGVGFASCEEIDSINILQATFLAMTRSVDALGAGDGFLVDGNRLPPRLKASGLALVGGDGRSLSIAAASVVAKVTRDRYMRELAREHPQYGFDVHMGYGTKAHRAAVEKWGPCPAHRMTFGFLKGYAKAA